ncbi:MAG: hypothetical protein WAW75_11080, partial [Gallionella sp.]
MYRLIGKIIAGVTFTPIVFGFFVVGFALAFSCNESGTISRCSNPDVVAPLAVLVFWTNRI